MGIYAYVVKYMYIYIKPRGWPPSCGIYNRKLDGLSKLSRVVEEIKVFGMQ